MTTESQPITNDNFTTFYVCHWSLVTQNLIRKKGFLFNCVIDIKRNSGKLILVYFLFLLTRWWVILFLVKQSFHIANNVPPHKKPHRVLRNGLAGAALFTVYKKNDARKENEIDQWMDEWILHPGFINSRPVLVYCTVQMRSLKKSIFGLLQIFLSSERLMQRSTFDSFICLHSLCSTCRRPLFYIPVNTRCCKTFSLPTTLWR